MALKTGGEEYISGMRTELVEIVDTPNGKQEYVWETGKVIAKNYTQVENGALQTPGDVKSILVSDIFTSNSNLNALGNNALSSFIAGAGWDSALADFANNWVQSLIGSLIKDESRNDNYLLTGFIPGDYMVRFVYGSTDEQPISSLLGSFLEKIFRIITPPFVNSYADYRGSTDSEGNPQYEDDKEYKQVYGTLDRTAISIRSGDSKGYIQRIIENKDIRNAIPYTGQDYESTKYVPKYSPEENTEGLFGGILKYFGSNRSKNSLATDSQAADNEYRRDELNKNFAIINNELGKLLALDYNNLEVSEIYTIPIITYTSGRLNELLRRTWMKADTDIYDISIDNKGESGIGLGLTERPTFNVKLDKEIELLTIKTNGGEVLLEAERDEETELLENKNDRPIKLNSTGPGQKGYYEVYDAKEDRIGYFKDALVINQQIDNILMGGAQVEIIYKIILTNAGNQEGNIRKVIDYVSDYIRFEDQDSPGIWRQKFWDTRFR